MSQSDVDSMAEFASHDPNNLLIGQPDGTLAERSTVPESCIQVERAVALGDHLMVSEVTIGGDMPKASSVRSTPESVRQSTFVFESCAR